MKDYKEIFKRNSFVNCTSIKPIARDRIVECAEYKGKLKEDDCKLIYEQIVGSKLITAKEKRQFGLID